MLDYQNGVFVDKDVLTESEQELYNTHKTEYERLDKQKRILEKTNKVFDNAISEVSEVLAIELFKDNDFELRTKVMLALQECRDESIELCRAEIHKHL